MVHDVPFHDGRHHDAHVLHDGLLRGEEVHDEVGDHDVVEDREEDHVVEDLEASVEDHEEEVLYSFLLQVDWWGPKS